MPSKSKSSPARGKASGTAGRNKPADKAVKARPAGAKGRQVGSAKAIKAVPKPVPMREPPKRGASAQVGRSSGSARAGILFPTSQSKLDLPAAEWLQRTDAHISESLRLLHEQVNATLGRLTHWLAEIPAGGSGPVQAEPLDRATAAFQRLLGEFHEEQMVAALPVLVSVRQELTGGRELCKEEGVAAALVELLDRAVEALDHVLALAGAHAYSPQVGEAYDSLIHMAVGEAGQDGLAEGAVARVIQPGFRTTRGRIIAQARVWVNRR